MTTEEGRTTVGIGLPPSHPGVWALTLHVEGAPAPLTIYSLTEPTHDPGMVTPFSGITPVPQSAFRTGGNTAIYDGTLRRPILAYAIHRIPAPTELASESEHTGGRPLAMTDEALRSAIEAHALTLADRLGPLGFPRTLARDRPGWSQSHLVNLCNADPGIKAGAVRMRTMVRTVLDEVETAWRTAHPTKTVVSETTGTTYQIPEGYPDFASDLASRALIDDFAAHREDRSWLPDPVTTRPILRRWMADVMAEVGPKPRTARSAITAALRQYGDPLAVRDAVLHPIDELIEEYGETASRDPLTWAAPEPPPPPDPTYN